MSSSPPKNREGAPRESGALLTAQQVQPTTHFASAAPVCDRASDAALLADAGVRYGQTGRRVIPMGEEKRPLIKTGKDHAEHSATDEPTIRRLFERSYPRNGGQATALGIVTGACSDLVVLDCDAKHDGEAKLAQLEVKLGPLPRDFVVRTKHGGIHCYFRHPQDCRVKSVAGKHSPLGHLVGDGVDVRGDGGYVVAPPSPGYVWERACGEYLPPLPATWIELLTTTTTTAPAPRKAQAAATAPPPNFSGASTETMQEEREVLRRLRRRYKRDARHGDQVLVDQILRGKALADFGGRDDACNRAGFILGLHLPHLGEAVHFLVVRSLMSMPIEAGSAETLEHFTRKLFTAYIAGAEAARVKAQEKRLAREWVATFLGFGGV